jgi:hypothetical protein
LKEGFKIELAKNGLLGKGIYFAENASYSTSYTSQIATDIGDVKNMLVCRVKLDEKSVSRDDIHCVSNQNQGYPAYIVYYTQSGK